MMSAKSSVIPQSKKLEKLVTATALRVKKAAKTTVFEFSKNVVLAVNVAINAERTTTRLVIEPSLNPQQLP